MAIKWSHGEKIVLILFDELASCPLYGLRRETLISWKEPAYGHLQLQTFGNLWLGACQARCPLRVPMSQNSKTFSFLFRVYIGRTPSQHPPQSPQLQLPVAFPPALQWVTPK